MNRPTGPERRITTVDMDRWIAMIRQTLRQTVAEVLEDMAAKRSDLVSDGACEVYGLGCAIEAALACTHGEGHRAELRELHEMAEGIVRAYHPQLSKDEAWDGSLFPGMPAAPPAAGPPPRPGEDPG